MMTAQTTMLEVYERLGTHCHDAVEARVVLTHAQRDKGRLKIVSDDGREVRIFLDRGKPLQVGEYLRTQCGKTLQVEGAIEDVTLARCSDWQTFAKACYHLGNRHVKVQVGELWLRMLPDHVLEDMLEQMGLELTREQEVFVPESGAYSNQGHSHNHGHSYLHAH